MFAKSAISRGAVGGIGADGFRGMRLKSSTLSRRYT